MDREAWRVAVHGVSKNPTRLSDWSELRLSRLSISCLEPPLNPRLVCVPVGGLSVWVWGQSYIPPHSCRECSVVWQRPGSQTVWVCAHHLLAVILGKLLDHSAFFFFFFLYYCYKNLDNSKSYHLRVLGRIEFNWEAFRMWQLLLWFFPSPPSASSPPAAAGSVRSL